MPVACYINAHPQLLRIVKNLGLNFLRAWRGAIADWGTAGLADKDILQLGDRGTRKARKKRDMQFPVARDCGEKIVANGLIRKGGKTLTVPRTVNVKLIPGGTLIIVRFE